MMDETRPLQRVLMDFDLKDPTLQVLGGDPEEFAEIPAERVKSIILEDRNVTIYAHQGDGQDLADLLAARPDVIDWVLYYAEYYWQDGVDSFAMRALDENKTEGLLGESSEERE